MDVPLLKTLGVSICILCNKSTTATLHCTLIQSSRLTRLTLYWRGVKNRKTEIEKLKKIAFQLEIFIHRFPSNK